MPTAVLVTSPYFFNNKMFAVDDPAYNRDNLLHPFWLMREEFRARGWDMVTADILAPQKADAVLYTEMPTKLPTGAAIAKNFLWLGEPPTVIAANWQPEKYKHFAKLFTWDTTLIDNQRFFRLNYSQKFFPQVPTNIHTKNLFCTVIAGNKTSSHPQELYSHRVRAIRWFENNASQGFDLYGTGWDSHTFSGLLRPLNRIPFFKKLFAPHFPSYRGKVSSKFKALQNYRFALAYENGYDIPGYITEKIFDCLQAGCVPVYWGAPDVTTFIPADCFIDMRNFMSAPNTPDYARLNTFLRNMDDPTYQGYVNRIAHYIQTTAMHGYWSSEYFAHTVASVITGIEKSPQNKKA